jgi:hypothetical protein
MPGTAVYFETFMFPPRDFNQMGGFYRLEIGGFVGDRAALPRAKLITKIQPGQ